MLATTSDANDYFMTKLHNKFWLNAIESKRQVALIEAHRILNRLAYIGTKVSKTQDDEFPRIIKCINVGTPNDILVALYEITYALLSGVDLEKEYEKLRTSSQSFKVSINYDSTKNVEHIVAGVPSVVAWTLLKPYVLDSREVRVNKV